jgi:hypothetical protein
MLSAPIKLFTLGRLKLLSKGRGTHLCTLTNLLNSTWYAVCIPK